MNRLQVPPGYQILLTDAGARLLVPTDFRQPPVPVPEVERATEHSAEPLTDQEQTHVQTEEEIEVLSATELARARSSRSHETGERRRALLEVVSRRGAWRMLARPDREQIAGLKCSHPHFGSVIDGILDEITLIERLDVASPLTPMLLIGPPGTGKTQFSLDLATCLQTPSKLVQFDADITSSRLGGGDKQWSNAEAGDVFNEVVLGAYANPMFVLDEIDKCRNSYINGDPRSVLHSLLERTTAAKFRDSFAGIEFDASHVSWICTANDEQSIPASLLSRMKIYHIEQPTGEDALLVAMSVFAQTAMRLNVQDFQDPPMRVIYRVAHLSAREICAEARRAIGRALVAGRDQVTVQDLSPEHGGGWGGSRLH